MSVDSRNRPPSVPILAIRAALSPASSGASSATRVGASPAPSQKTRPRSKSLVQPAVEGLIGSAPLRRVLSSRIGPAESILAGTPHDQIHEEEGGGGGDEEATPVEDYYPEGGWRAWACVFATLALVCCQLGYGLAWGVFSGELKKTTHQNTSLATLNLVVGLNNFMMNGGSFVSGRLGDRYGYKRMIAINIFATFVSLIISAFTSQYLWGLFVFQGFFLGVSQGIGMPLFLSLPCQFFLKRRGLATGVAISGAGIGGAVASLIVRGLLPHLGYTYTLLVYACINFFVSVIAWFFLEVRVLPPQVGKPRVSKNWLPKGVWHDPAFYSLMACLGIGIFGFLLFFYCVTAYTVLRCPDLDPNSIMVVVPLVIGNLCSGLGRIFAGVVADYLGPVNCMFFSFFIGGIFQLVVWPFCTNFGTIVMLSALYGFFGSWFMSLLPVVCAQLFGMRGLSTITGFAVLVNSPGQFIGATLGSFILTASGGYNAVGYFGGGTMVVGALFLLVARFTRVPHLFKVY